MTRRQRAAAELALGCIRGIVLDDLMPRDDCGWYAATEGARIACALPVAMDLALPGWAADLHITEATHRIVRARIALYLRSVLRLDGDEPLAACVPLWQLARPHV